MIYISIVLLLLSILITIGNIHGIITAAIRKKKGINKGYSSIPLFSFLFSTGAWLLSRELIGFWAFLPTILDPGTWSLIIGLPFALYQNFSDKKNK